MEIAGNTIVIEDEKYSFSHPIQKVVIYDEFLIIRTDEMQHLGDTRYFPHDNIYFYSNRYNPKLKCISEILDGLHSYYISFEMVSDFVIEIVELNGMVFKVDIRTLAVYDKTYHRM